MIKSLRYFHILQYINCVCSIRLQISFCYFHILIFPSMSNSVQFTGYNDSKIYVYLLCDQRKIDFQTVVFSHISILPYDKTVYEIRVQFVVYKRYTLYVPNSSVALVFIFKEYVWIVQFFLLGNVSFSFTTMSVSS